MRVILIAVFLMLPGYAFAQDIGTKNTVPVPSDGVAGGANPTVWKAQCKDGMVMTGIEIVVGGTCHNQCNADGRPLAAYRILCSELQGGKATRTQYAQ